MRIRDHAPNSIYSVVVEGRRVSHDARRQSAPVGRAAADLDADGVVNVTDLLTLLGNWGS